MMIAKDSFNQMRSKSYKLLNMMIKIQVLVIFMIAAVLFSPRVIVAEDEDIYDISQGEFAVQLVNVLKLQSYLTAAPLENDYIEILELFGISPLKGWDRRETLTEEDYIVIMARLTGQEREVYQVGVEFCDKVVHVINEAWKKQAALDGEAKPLKELLEDDRFFSEKAPQCPFGHSYHARKDHTRVCKHHHMQAWLTSLRLDKKMD